MPALRLFGALALFVTAALSPVWPVCAQTLPNHVDPTAREQLIEPGTVPAIRFLSTPGFPPFNYRDTTGELVGFHIDLAKAICEELDAVCTMQSWPWEQAADALTDNQGDALIAGLALSQETGARFDFSSVYLAFPARFVTRKQDAGTFDPQHLQDKKIAIRAGGAHARFAMRFLTGAELVEAPSELEALAMVAQGTAYAYFGDAMRAAFWLNDNAGCCAFAGDAYFRPDYFGQGLAIAVPAGRDSLRVALDAALVRLKRNGRIDELYLRWFPIAFY